MSFCYEYFRGKVRVGRDSKREVGERREGMEGDSSSRHSDNCHGNGCLDNIDHWAERSLLLLCCESQHCDDGR